jgi:NADH:ubiquinone oxidoreductase subunit H
MNSAALEIFKFSRITLIWLSIIFGAVWFACWLVGIALPEIAKTVIPDKGTADLVVAVLQGLTPIVSIAVFIPINAMFMVLCERRALALFTQRKGPNRVGVAGFNLDGFFQTAADAVKLLLKEDITPKGADPIMFTLAPIIFFAPSIIGAVPLIAALTSNNELFRILNLPTGIFYILAVASIPVVGIVMGGWASNNKYSLVGGLRSAAQAISYEIPLVLSLITICLLNNTLDVLQIVQQQTGGLLYWNIFGNGALVNCFNPLTLGSAIAALVLVVSCFLLFGIYLTSACAEVNRIPFDLPEAESELVSGYNTEYSGIKFAIFFLAEFTNLFVVAGIASVMFLGGGQSPLPPSLIEQLPGIKDWATGLAAWQQSFAMPFIEPATFFGAFWIIVKAYTLVIFAILVRATLPRFRIDQLLDFGWKRLIPLTLILFLAVTFAREFV